MPSSPSSITCISRGKQLILSSDKPPKDLEGVQERLLSRFRWGLSADLQIPDYEIRIEILERKMKNDGLEMPKEVVKYLAYNINSNVTGAGRGADITFGTIFAQ